MRVRYKHLESENNCNVLWHQFEAIYRLMKYQSTNNVLIMNITSLESFTKYVHDAMIEIQISLNYLKIKSKITPYWIVPYSRNAHFLLLKWKFSNIEHVLSLQRINFVIMRDNNSIHCLKWNIFYQYYLKMFCFLEHHINIV